VDFYGISQYPKHNRPGDWNRRYFMTNADFSYSANKKNGGYYVGEFQSGFGTVGLRIGDEVTPADQRIWFWSSLATGARAVNIYAFYPMNSGYESGGYGLINLDGTITERARALGEIAAFVDQRQELFLKSKPVKAQIALVYNPLAQMVGGEGDAGGRGSGHINSLIGYYRVLSAYNIPVEFIHRRDLENSNFSQYKLIITPYSVMFTQKAADNLRSFVEQGGFAVAEARMAWNDDRGYATDVIPGMGLNEVFGVRESKVEVKDNIPITIIDNSHPSLARLSIGDALAGNHFAETVVPLDETKAKILANLADNTPGLVASTFGEGETLYIGSFLSNDPTFHESNTQFILGLMDWAQIQRPFTSSHDGDIENPVVIRLHENPEGFLLYVLNQGWKTEKITVQLNLPEEGNYMLTEILQGREMFMSSINSPLEISTADIRPSDVEIWEIVNE
ncbi:beta-galactosidase trimerization domain-containing protein, partial [Bacteroidota bacterium]